MANSTVLIPSNFLAYKNNYPSALNTNFRIKIPWIIDSGASDHMTDAYHLFSSYSPCAGNLKVKIADGSLSSVAGKGSIKLSDSITLESVLHVPKLSCNLLSISKLTKDSNCYAKFLPSYCVFQDLSSGKTIGSAKECEGLYYFEETNGVYHCGYHSDKSYGAASYFVVHPQGNILIDSPRYTERLAGNIEKLGGVHYMFLTHKDDIADHDKWFKRFRCNRIMHSKEIGKNTVDVEIKLEGNGPWNFSPDFDIIHTPGHTEGSVCLFYKPLKILFTGDHLSMSEFGLSIGEMYNWYSVPMQLNSVKLLIQLDFEWILPGHGRREEFKDVADKNSAIESLLAAMLPV